MIKHYNTPTGTVTVDTDTYDGNPDISVYNKERGIVATMHLDNYQTYQLAMTLLSTVEVDDTRGSK